MVLRYLGIAAAVVALIGQSLAAAESGPVKLSTGDGLEIRLNQATGALDGLSIDGKACKTSGGAVVSLEMVDLSTPGENVASNGGFESGEGWNLPASGAIDDKVFHSGKSSLRVERKSREDASSQAVRTITLDQKEAEPVYIRVWSKAELPNDELGGLVNMSAAVIVTVIYQDGEKESRNQYAYLPQYTHDWLQSEAVICPEKPIKTIELKAGIWGDIYGKYWLDDLEVRPVKYVRESVSAPLVREGNIWHQEAVLLKLNTRVWLTYRALDKDIEVGGELESLDDSDKAITAKVSLPIDAIGGKWWHGGRYGDEIKENACYWDSIWYGAGKYGSNSNYPWSAIDVPNAGSIAVGVPIDQPQIHRLMYNGVTKSYNAEFDLGLAKDAPMPRRASFSTIVYKADSGSAFRDATERYYALYPWAFEKRVKKEGLWCPFNSVKDAGDWKKFGLQFNESTQDFGWEAQQGSTTLMYIEPGCAHTQMYFAGEHLDTKPLMARVNDAAAGKQAFGGSWHPKDPWVIDAAGAILANTQTDFWGNPSRIRFGDEDSFLLNPAPGVPPAPGFSSSEWDVNVRCVDEGMSLKGKYHLDDWLPYSYDYVEGYALDNTNPKSGKQCIRLDTNVHYAHWSPWLRGVQQIINLPQPVSGPVELSFWARGDEVTSGKLRAVAVLGWNDGKVQEIALRPEKIGKDWQEYKLTANPERPVKYCYLVVNMEGFEGTVWVDNLRFGTADGKTNFVKDGDFENGQWYDGRIAGVYLDTLECTQAFMNYRREHFPYLQTNLSFDWARRVSQPHIFGAYEFAKAISEKLHKDGKLLMANACPANTAFCIPYVDIGGNEEEWVPGGGWAPKSDSMMLWNRAMCKAKPFCILLQSRGGTDMVRKQVARCAFYGVYPSYGQLASGDERKLQTAYYWNKDVLEQDRPIFEKYAPVIQRIDKAGWQPVTFAKSSNEVIWIERFGNVASGDCYFTLYNYTTKDDTTKVSIDRVKLGLKGSVQIEPVLGNKNGATVAANSSEFTVNVPAEDVVVLRVKTAAPVNNF